MPTEIKGNQLRIRLKNPKQYSKIRIHDVGKKGGLQRVAGYKQNIGWKTQSWRLNLKDFNQITAINTVERLNIPYKQKQQSRTLIRRYYEKT